MAGKRLPALVWSTVLTAIVVMFLPTASSWLIPFAPPRSPAPAPSAYPPSGGIKGGYWPSSIAQTLPPSMIPTTYFTHVFYAFVGLNNSTYQLEITQLDDQWMTNFTATLHATSPSTKAFLSVGGGRSNSSTFSLMCANATYRSYFIQSTMAVARKYNFDGIDLDWEFPPTPQDMSNLGLLLQEWHYTLLFESVTNGKPRILISAAVYFSAEFFLDDGRMYPIYAINKHVDILNLMCYDYHGKWDVSVTGEHALLFDNGNISTSYGISSWISAGVSPEKLIMGLPLYGKTWLLKDPNVNGIGAPAVDVGPGDDGIMTFSEILDFNFGSFATAVYDNKTVSTYSYSGNIWVGYDGDDSTRKKVKYAKRQGLGGYFFWALGNDKDWILSSTASMAWDNN